MSYDRSEQLSEELSRVETGASELQHQEFTRAVVGENSDEGSSAERAAAKEEDAENEPEMPAVRLRRTESKLSRVVTGFFSDRMHTERRTLLGKFLLNHLLLGMLIMAVFSLYWGAMYKRSSHLHKVKVLAVIQDDGGDGGSAGGVATAIPQLLESVPGTWHVYNTSSFQQRYGVAGGEIDAKIHKLVHDEKYWMSLNVKPNATNALLDSVRRASAPAFNSSQYFEAFYESGRDPTNMKSTILPLMLQLEALHQNYHASVYLPAVLQNASQTMAQAARNVAQAGRMVYGQVDSRPFSDYVLLGPLQVGLIYCILLTFFQLALFGPIHGQMGQKLKPSHMLLYRYTIAFVNYFFLSLFFCLVSLAFQVDYTKTFGRGGFMVAWMTSWLLMAAVGGANENMITMVMSVAPQFLGFWMIFWVVLNISPSFYPMDLTNNFYRYGYMTPIYNGVMMFRVIFLDLYRGNLGRNYGILCAWVVVNMALFPFVMKFFIHQKKKEVMRAAAARNAS
ncbi:SNG1 family protein [Lachancea thermotolerans CBS 6340]|uniref:KLTH0F19492p n=1 Tax=Lachancea thermotolerans (strain ATCC 56472 / CBS 6340 / NRRL Y-8284) TaxID=559295 RepID=C5DJV8_LACTC|nr:KLTH0F19492p [Lachancea thermotolerans CBS 6340]CAR24597.1 KLTH0F19492p [Lachancea thermotolerans CBS 6340]